ncbi:MAG: YbjN domain-containing protein [Acidobacteriota bacterium]
MTKIPIAAVPIALALIAGQLFAQQVDPAQTPPPKVARPAPRLTFADRIKQYLQRIGSTADESKSTPDMVVSNYPEPKGGKVTIVLVNDRRRNLLGFYIYNFGSVKDVANKEEVYKYLLAANDSITIGSFFVDSEDDIGYKYLVSSAQAMNQPAFEYAYVTMAAVARERKPEIKKLLGTVSEKDEKPPDVKKAAEEKPPGD